MNHNLLETLESLGPLEKYRQAGEVEEYVRKVEIMMRSLQGEFQTLPSERERIKYVLETLEKMLLTARRRACDCELQMPLACENVDVFHVMAEWLAFARESFKK